VAAALEPENEAILVSTDPPLRMRADFRKGHGAGENLQRASFWILNVRGGGQGEGGLLAAEIAGRMKSLRMTAEGGALVADPAEQAVAKRVNAETMKGAFSFH